MSLTHSLAEVAADLEILQCPPLALRPSALVIQRAAARMSDSHPRLLPPPLAHLSLSRNLGLCTNSRSSSIEAITILWRGWDTRWRNSLTTTASATSTITSARRRRRQSRSPTRGRRRKENPSSRWRRRWYQSGERGGTAQWTWKPRVSRRA